MWRSDLLWRLIGLSIFELAILDVAFVESWELFFAYRLQWLFSAAIVLMVGGSRPLALLAGWLLTLVHFAGELTRSAEVQLAEEFGVFVSLPVLGLIGYAVAHLTEKSAQAADGRSFEAHGDAVQVALFRAAAVSILLCATLHKINSDFLNAAVSCGPILAAEISEWWRLPLPDLIVRASPWQIIVSEGLCPVLLLLAPRLGIVWTTLVIGVIGQRGATAFVMLAVALSLSFLRHEDGRRLGEAAKRYWPWIVALTLCLVTVSAKTYVARRPWYEFLYLHVFLLLVAYAGAHLLWCDVCEALSRGTLLRNAADGLRLRAIARRISPGPRAVHAFVATVWLVATLNGLTPYLGWKYRLSFAMLSNLRVDDARWNSLVFPRWLRTSAHDPYVHIDGMTMDLRAHQVLANLERPQTRAIAEGLVSPMSLEYRMRYVRYHALNIDIDLTYNGEHFYFADVADNREFHDWLDGLPMTLLIQDYLVDVGPQPCIH